MRSSVSVIAILALVAGCGGSTRSKSADTVGSVTTVDQELGAAQEQLGKTVKSLSDLISGTTKDINAGYDQFASDLSALDSKVQTVRDRTVAMGAKRDAYLKQWIEQSSKITNESMKAQAEQRRTQLQTEFMDLNGKGNNLKKAYAPLNAALHDCQRYLEADLNPAGVKSLSEEIGKITASQKEVDAASTEFRNALKALIEKLGVPPPADPAKAPAEKK